MPVTTGMSHPTTPSTKHTRAPQKQSRRTQKGRARWTGSRSGKSDMTSRVQECASYVPDLHPLDESLLDHVDVADHPIRHDMAREVTNNLMDVDGNQTASLWREAP